jgi:hypothetical protein
MSQPSGRKQGSRLALRRSYTVGSIVLFIHQLALRHNHQVGSKVLVLLYVTTIRSEAGYSSCFTSQPSGQKQDTRLALRHSYPAGSSVLVISHYLALRHNHPVGSKRCLHHNNYSPFRTIPSLSRKCSNFTRDRGLVNTSTTCSSVLMYWNFKAPLCTMSQM